MNIVFLDIDGVIVPYNALESQYHIHENIQEKLTKKYNADYTKYNAYEVYSAYYDWNKKALKNLKIILEETKSKIIVSSDWRDENKPDKIKDFLKIHKLDNYWFEDNIINKKYGMDPVKKRVMEINQSIYDYPITNFVILDDMIELKKYFPNNYVKTYDYLKEDNVKEAIRILNNKSINK